MDDVVGRHGLARRAVFARFRIEIELLEEGEIVRQRARRASRAGFP
jgi:hypothetical protein